MKWIPIFFAVAMLSIFLVGLGLVGTSGVKIIVEACDPAKPQIICSQVTRNLKGVLP